MSGTHHLRGVFQPTFGPARRESGSVTLSFIGDTLLLASDDSLPAPSSLEALGSPQHSLEFGRVGQTAYEMQTWPAQAGVPSGLTGTDNRELLGRWPQFLLEAACRARQLASWLQENRFCGACGSHMETALLSPARKCVSCGFVAYPRISPVCIALVARGDEILLARSPHFPPGIYSTLAGFVEAGETLEDCVHREVREETGIEIRDLRWFGSQSWPQPHSLMLGFFAEYAGGTLTPQREEIEDAQWFRRNRLPSLPHPTTIASRMIEAWRERGDA